LEINTYTSTALKTVVRLGFGCMAVLMTAVTADAQTTYYYPSLVTSTPGVATGTTAAPTYYYRRGLFGRRYVTTGYSMPYYQATNSPPPQQAATTPPQDAPANQNPPPSQPQPAQTASNSQVIPTSYTTSDPKPTATTAAASTDAGDPYGFTSWLNATRAAYGLPAVGHDPNLSSWAAENNNHQAARGIGHFVMGPARRQNSAFGSVSNIGAMWMGSPAHRAALLDPTIRWIGIAGLGAYWTFNAN
jgi:uncharacterized protein YkwD